jgi:hypothetical protein
MRPFRALNGLDKIRLTLLERMAGTTRLELATSAVTAFNDMEEHGRHCKSLEVRRRQRYCVSRCVSRGLLPTMGDRRVTPGFAGRPESIPLIQVGGHLEV